jgi:hypothetical protein
MKITRIVVLLAVFLGLTNLSRAQEAKTDSLAPAKLAIGLNLSTYGPGLELIKGLNDQFTLRLGIRYLPVHLKINQEVSGMQMNLDNNLKMNTLSLISDYHFAKYVHLSGGVFINLTKIETTISSLTGKTFGVIEITPEAMGTITASLKPSVIAPYLGIGFGRNLPFAKKVAFNFELGAVYQGGMKAEMNGTGMIAPTASSEQSDILTSNLSPYKFYPFMMFQLSYRIN